MVGTREHIPCLPLPSTDYFWKKARLPIPAAEKAPSTESRLQIRSGWMLTWLIQPFVALYAAYYVYLGLRNVFLFKDLHTFQSFIGFIVTLPIGKATNLGVNFSHGALRDQTEPISLVGARGGGRNLHPHLHSAD